MPKDLPTTIPTKPISDKTVSDAAGAPHMTPAGRSMLGELIACMGAVGVTASGVSRGNATAAGAGYGASIITCGTAAKSFLDSYRAGQSPTDERGR